MQPLLKQYLILFLLASTSFAQEISFSKDSLNFTYTGYQPPQLIADSVVVKNAGDKILLIDSIYSKNAYGYQLQAGYKDSLYHHNIYDPSDLLNLSIAAGDSVTFIFYDPDLCPICISPADAPFQDSIIIHSNSKSSPYSYLFASGVGSTSVETNSPLRTEFSLAQNYPNPFSAGGGSAYGGNPSTTIEYVIPNVETTRRVVSTTLKVYDLLGREIATLVDEYKQPGKYFVHFNVTQISNLRNNISSGIYFYTLRVHSSASSGRDYSLTRKMIYLK